MSTKNNECRFDADVTEDDTHVTVHLTNDNDEQVDLPLTKSLTPSGKGTILELQLVSETKGAIHGSYVDEHGNEFEAILWFDGQVTSEFENFGFKVAPGSANVEADTILWRSDSDR